MEALIEHIQYLLIEHDCVVVPGLGAFLAANVSASLDAEAGMFMPPKRMLSFNADIKHSDGLLAASIARRQKVSYQQAASMVSRSVEALCGHLRQEGSIALDRIGTLTLADGVLLFEPQPQGLLTPTLAYLKPVAAVPLSKSDDADAAAAAVAAAPAGRVRRAAWRVAASIAVLLGLGIVLTTPIAHDHQVVEATTAVVPTAPRPTVYNVPKAEIANMPQMVVYAHADGHATVDTLARTRHRQARLLATGGNYAIIVASMPDMAGAHKFMAMHPGRALQCAVQPNGNVRVYAATAHTSQEAYAISLSDDFKKDFPQSWVTRLN